MKAGMPVVAVAAVAAAGAVVEAEVVAMVEAEAAAGISRGMCRVIPPCAVERRREGDLPPAPARLPGASTPTPRTSTITVPLLLLLASTATIPLLLLLASTATVPLLLRLRRPSVLMHPTCGIVVECGNVDVAMMSRLLQRTPIAAWF